MDQLAFALIEETCQGDGLSDISFNNLVKLFFNSEILASESLHDLTTALWTDTETLTEAQYFELGNKIEHAYFEKISRANTYSICDMVASAWPKLRALEILKTLSKQELLAEAANYSISTLE